MKLKLSSVSLKEYVKSQLRPLCTRLALLVLLYSFFRLLFFIVNADIFPNARLSIFFYGIRFDLTAIFYTNALYIIAVLLPFSFYFKKIYRRICDLYFIIVNCFVAMISFIDVAYYPYVLKRITADFFSYIQVGFDFQALLPSFFKQFWYLFLLFFVTVFAIIMMVRITNKMITKKPVLQTFSWKNLLFKILILLVSISLSFICMRGGLQSRPIGLIDAGKPASIQNAALVSNTPFTLIFSLGKSVDIERYYFQDLEEAEQYFSPVINSIMPCTQGCYPVKNIIVIVLENFSQYLIKGMDLDTNSVDSQGYCPFLHHLLQQSISFNGIANARHTIAGIPAIFGGIPALFHNNYISYVESSFANNYFYSPVLALKNHGFHTLFFHGAKNGSMNIENYCYSIGFDKYYGMNEYPNSSDFDGTWGISDRSFLKFVAKTLRTAPQPFFAGILTLSSHNPYTIPKDAKDLDLKPGEHPVFATASYTDYAIKDFFETISHNSWFDSTLFIITGDHTGPGTIPVSGNTYMFFQVPIFFYHPMAHSGKTKGIMQQTDIMPTLFSYLKIDEPIFSFGNNVFDPTFTPFAVNQIWGTYQLITDDFILQFDGEKSVGFFDVKKDKLMLHNLINDLPDEVARYEKKLKAVIQSYTTRMAKNQLFIK
jgi:phosphoglycerol transferase MdoB-like AlkP superfamily enzyme